MAAQYLAGFLFLQWVHSDPKTATPLTVARYGYYFGERSDIRRKLWVSSGAGLALVMLPVILALRPRTRPLHGSARFSTRGEARQAGLFSPVGITGYVPDILASVSAVGNDFALDGGNCGKGWKEWVPVSSGGPHLRLKARLG